MQVVINVLVGVAAITVMAGVVLLIQRGMDQRVALAREKLLLLRAVEERQALFVNLSNDYKRLTPLFPAVYSILPHAENVIMFADMVEAVAKETGNTIAFQFETSEPSFDSVFATVAHVQFHAKVEGTGESFNRFLQRLEALRYIHGIDAISIDGPQGIYGGITTLIKGTVFIQKDSIVKK